MSRAKKEETENEEIKTTKKKKATTAENEQLQLDEVVKASKEEKKKTTEAKANKEENKKATEVKDSKKKIKELKKIENPQTEEEIANNKVYNILKSAKESGKITYGELASQLGDVTPDQIDKVFDVFEELGVDVLKDDTDDEPDIEDLEEVEEIMNSKPGFIKAMWCGDEACEDENQGMLLLFRTYRSALSQELQQVLL